MKTLTAMYEGIEEWCEQAFAWIGAAIAAVGMFLLMAGWWLFLLWMAIESIDIIGKGFSAVVAAVLYVGYIITKSIDAKN